MDGGVELGDVKATRPGWSDCQKDEQQNRQPLHAGSRTRAEAWLHRLELDLHVLAVFRALHLKELPRLEAEHAGDDVDGKGLDPSVVIADHGVVIAAGILDVVFDRVERSLQSRELLGGLQLGIVFGYG